MADQASTALYPEESVEALARWIHDEESLPSAGHGAGWDLPEQERKKLLNQARRRLDVMAPLIAPLVANDADQGGRLPGLGDYDFSTIYTLLNREWEWDMSDPQKPSVITPEIRKHLDYIEVLIGKVHRLRVSARDAAAGDVEEQKEMARQAFMAGAEFAGVELEDPERQFAAFWERQVDHAIDAGTA